MVHVKSLLPDPPVLPPLNIHSFLLEREETPDHVLYIDGINGRKWTKQQFKERVRILRTVLGRETAEGGLGLKAPTMVAIFSENCMPPPTPPEGQISTIIGCLPVYHTFGLHYYCFVPFLTPTTVIFIPKWNTDLGLSLIPKYKVTTILAVPSILHQISTSPKLAKTDMSSVIGFGSGAAYLPPTLANKLSDQVGRGVMVAHGYGLSEATMSAINMIYDGQLDGKWKYTPDCSGGLIPGMEARIVREDGTEADYEEVGELWLKGPNIAMGYYGNPKATAEAFVDGWLRTGDLFKVNEEGYFWYQDRGKDTLKVSGMQVSPMEIENSLFQHPLVKDAAVAGVLASSTDATLSERVPRAWVVLTDQGKTKRKDQMRKELDTWVQQRLSKYKWLRGGIEFVEQIPKSATGKVLRRQLVDKYTREHPVHATARL
ncbi:hypothetical protein FRC19_011343 [Serendipita sp. 401]|nr:hypothetical protein FRC19_011343 [Serendipita sp. 401]